MLLPRLALMLHVPRGVSAYRLFKFIRYLNDVETLKQRPRMEDVFRLASCTHAFFGLFKGCATALQTRLLRLPVATALG